MIIIEFVDNSVESCSGTYALRNLAPKLKKGFKAIYEVPTIDIFIKDNLKDLKKALDKYKIKDDEVEEE